MLHRVRKTKFVLKSIKRKYLKSQPAWLLEICDANQYSFFPLGQRDNTVSPDGALAKFAFEKIFLDLWKNKTKPSKAQPEPGGEVPINAAMLEPLLNNCTHHLTLSFLSVLFWVEFAKAHQRTGNSCSMNTGVDSITSLKKIKLAILVRSRKCPILRLDE